MIKSGRSGNTDTINGRGAVNYCVEASKTSHSLKDLEICGVFPAAGRVGYLANIMLSLKDLEICGVFPVFPARHFKREVINIDP